MLKKFLNIVILGGLVAIAFYWFYRDFEKPTTSELDTLKAIPQSAAVILESQNMAEVWRDLASKSLVWDELRSTDFFYQFNELAQNLDSLIRGEAELRAMLSGKPMVLSAHMTGGSQFGFLFAIRIDYQSDRVEADASLKSTFRATEFESRIYDGESVNSFLSPFFDGRIFYFLKDDLLVFGLSEVLIEESVRTLVQDASVLNTRQFNAVRETVDRDARAHVFVNYELFKPLIAQYASPESRESEFFKQPFADWSALDFSIGNNSLSLNGFVMAGDSSRAWLDAFSPQKPPKVKLLQYLPSNCAFFAFMGYGDYRAYRIEKNKKLEKNGSLFKVQSAIKKYDEACNCDAEDLGSYWIGSQALTFISEPASKDYSQNVYAVFNTEDSQLAEEKLKQWAEAFGEVDESEFEGSTYFRLPVGNFYGDVVGDAFKGLQNPFVLRIKDAIVMANSENAVRNYLSAIQSGRSFTETEEYRDLKGYLFDDAHFVLYSYMAKSPAIYRNILDEKFDADLEQRKEVLRNFKAFTYQISHSSGDLFYNNVYLEQGSDYKPETGALWEVKLRAETEGRTHLVKNHYTGVLEVLVQDVNNRIYLISNNGKIIWETTLDGPIMGSVKQLDVYKNKKLQMLFNTAEKVYLLDRNGNSVESFPIALGSKASAEVGLADYDNSRDYRIFIPTVNEKILCFDSYGKAVDGWEYSGSSGVVVLPVEHVRIKRKDYLFSMSENGDILLLNRKGEPRHEVGQKAEGFKMGGYRLDVGSKISTSSLYFSDKDGNAYRLGFDDSIEKIKPRPQNSTAYFFANIDGDKSMDFGFLFEETFSAFSFQGDMLFDIELAQSNCDELTLYQSGRSSLFSVLHSGKNQVYLFDENGQSISGFPVFGSSIPSLGDVNLDGYVNLITTGKDGYVYAYSIEQN